MYKAYNRTMKRDPLTGNRGVEFCVKVVDGPRRKGRQGDTLKDRAGDGNWGFSTRRVTNNDNLVVEVDVDGQPMHIGRKSQRTPKRGCRLLSRQQCKGRDTLTDKLAYKALQKGKPRWRARKGQKPENCRRSL